MKRLIAGIAIAACSVCSPAAAEELHASLQAKYPSLMYVERYRAAHSADVQGTDAAWKRDDSASTVATAKDISQLLVGLADQHVALTGPKAGKTETLGVLFRTSSDGQMIVWRVLDAAIRDVSPGDRILSVDGRPTREWLLNAARLTFGGNDRSRQAEAALTLGLGTPAAHEVLEMGKTVTLTAQNRNEAVRKVKLSYQPMTQPLATALTAAVDVGDLPEVVRIGKDRVGTIRMGAFAPQYSAAFNAAAEAVEAASPQSKETDEPMLAGFCAVTRELIDRYDAIASRSDLMLLDLRGNMGGFAREVRGFAWALTGKVPVKTYEMVASGKPGIVRLEALPDDPSCGTVRSPKPLLVLVDAGTRSAGELLATYLWESGATVLGERTIGAGGGRDSQSKGIPMGDSGYRALVSENFYVFDPTRELHAGEMDEAQLIDRVTAEGFQPSRQRPYATQSIGVLPDVPLLIEARDLKDGGQRLLERGVPAARALLP